MERKQGYMNTLLINLYACLIEKDQTHNPYIMSLLLLSSMPALKQKNK